MNSTATPLRTDTVRLAPVVVDDPDTTVEFRPPWLKPPVTATYATPRVRIADRWRRVRYSPAADHVRAATSSAFWPASVGAGFIVAALVLAHLHGATPTAGIR